MTMIGNEFAEALLREMKLEKPMLPCGCDGGASGVLPGGVSGVRSDHFCGQDLGFGDGLCYAPGTSYEDVWRPELSRFCTVEMKQWEQIVRERPLMRKIPDYQGRPMYTEERLFTYLQQFERDFGKSTARIIDATEGGAAKRGAVAMTLAEAIGEFCSKSLAENCEALPAPPPRHRIGMCWMIAGRAF